MISYVHRHRVRYRECDPMGVVYHTHYLDWFEAARTEALRSQGVAYAGLEADGVIMPVTEASLKYHASARYDDAVEITATFLDVPRVRVTIDYAVRREGESAVLVSGRTVLCFVDVARGRPVAAPEAVVEAFRRAERDAA